ncbi:MAG TPA: hypothetical protein VJC03_04145, partial [bacterium]|nr:hypothetical protein [bacterium]
MFWIILFLVCPFLFSEVEIDPMPYFDMYQTEVFQESDADKNGNLSREEISGNEAISGWFSG